MKVRGLATLVLCTLGGLNVLAKEAHEERLTVWQLPNQFNLLSFDWSFSISEHKEGVQQIDTFPQQVYQMARSYPGLMDVQVDLVQGRWHQNFIKRVLGYEVDPNGFSSELPSDFIQKEHGLSISTHTQESISPDELQKLYGQLSTQMALAIYEERAESFELLDPINENLINTYFSKPNEPLCRENIAFLFKHLNQTNFDSGIKQLVNKELLHDTNYKHLQFRYERRADGDLFINYKLSYVTESKAAATFNEMLKTKVEKLVPCLNCDDSEIRLAQADGSFQVLHKKSVGTVSVDSLLPAQVQTVEPEHCKLTSERSLQDMVFSKEAKFYHYLRNSHDDQFLEVITQDYFIESVKPYMHTLTIKQRSLATGQVTTVPRGSYTVKNDYFRSDENIVTISGLRIRPMHEVVISFEVLKSLRHFEKYSNEPARGDNVPQMPIYYKGKDDVWHSTESTSLLVTIPEPDFSMPFNVNATINMVLGVFLINMYNSLVKPQRFISK